MSIYQLKSRDYYIAKSFEDENFRKNTFHSMEPRVDIFLIDEHFNAISVATRSIGLQTVNIYKINRDDSTESTNLKARNFYQMTIVHQNTAIRQLNDFSEDIVRNFLNSYLNSEEESIKIKRIKDRMSFLAYVIEYK